MNKQKRVAALVVFALLAGCGHSGTVPAPSDRVNTSGVSPNAGIVTGNFTEFVLPAGIHPSEITHGPYGTLYFVAPEMGGASATVYRMVNTTGVVASFTAPAPYVNSGNSSIIGLNRSVFYIVADSTQQNLDIAARVTPEGTFSFNGPALGGADSPYTNFAMGPNGQIWSAFCVESCSTFPGSIVNGGSNLLRLDFPFVVNALTPGPGNDMYLTVVAMIPGGTTPPAALIDVVSTAAVILHKFALPNGADPQGIATGSDHNLWITEPGINKIARMTPGGAFTQFSIPTANADPRHIVGGVDGNLYFTESAANKIGRITTSGQITEFKIPTANSGPAGILSCSTVCPPRGGVWFAEQTANKIGKFIFP
jgi:streptogramin lyase